MIKNALKNVRNPEWWKTATPHKVGQYYHVSHQRAGRLSENLSTQLEKTLDAECIREHGYTAFEYAFEQKSHRDIGAIIDAHEVAQQEKTASRSTSVPEAHYYSLTNNQGTYRSPGLDLD